MDVALERKLKLSKYKSVGCLGHPSTPTQLSELPQFKEANQSEGCDLLIAFVYALSEMSGLLPLLPQSLEALYFAYPKRGNKLRLPHIGRDDIFPHLGVDDTTGFIAGTDWRFNMMVALDENFTIVGLKRDVAHAVSKFGAGHSVDFADRLPELEAKLKGSPVSEFFARLTPGYKRTWASYIYSAKKPETQERRYQEMQETLSLGFKTREHRRASAHSKGSP